MKSSILFTLLLCNLSVAGTFLIYKPTVLDIEFNLYEEAVDFELPLESYDKIKDDLHRAYAISGSLPLVTVDRWFANVTPAYFELNDMTQDEFRKKVDQLGERNKRTDFLVYDVRLSLGESTYAVLAICRDEDTLTWEEGLNLSSAIFEKGLDGRWLRTTLPQNHWIYSVPFLNVDSLEKLVSGRSLIIDENSVVRFLSTVDIENLDRVSFLEQ